MSHVTRFVVRGLVPSAAEMSYLGQSGCKEKVVFVMGATGTGKSKLAIALASYYGGEIVNSDKMQVYDGLPIITNKVSEDERGAAPHHLIGGIHPDDDYTPVDFRRDANRTVESILQRGRLPIIAGGSNRYIEELVEGEGGEFKDKYECCFLWLDVDQHVLHEYVAERVDQMVEQGLVEEARGVFHLEADYSRGLRRSIGVPEMDRYLRIGAEEREEERARLLEAAIDDVKVNTCKLTCRQVGKIQRLQTEVGWDVQRIDSTEMFLRRNEAGAKSDVWEKVVGRVGRDIVQRFLHSDNGIENVYASNGIVAAASLVQATAY